jgi:hypothetical protein
MKIKNIKIKNFYFIMAGVFILIYVMQNLNGRFWLNDFEVYYGAAKNMLDGKDIYGEAFGLGTGFFKYSPASVFLFIPFVFFPPFVAKTIYFFIIGLFIVLVIEKAVFILNNYLGFQKVNESLLKIFILLITAAHLHREVHLGNINVILLFIVLSALVFLLKGKKIEASALIGLAIIIKPHFVCLLPLLLIRKDIRTFFLSVASALIYLLIPSLIFGFTKNLKLLSEWRMTMFQHNSSDGLMQDVNSLYHFFNNIIGKYIFGTNNNGTIIIVTSLVAIGILVLVIVNLIREKKNKSVEKANFVFEYILILALIPSITKTDTEHFLFSLPLIMYILAMFTQKVISSKVILAVTIIGFLMYGANIRDLWGKHLSDIIADFGMLGMGNILLMVIALVIFMRKPKIVDEK